MMSFFVISFRHLKRRPGVYVESIIVTNYVVLPVRGAEIRVNATRQYLKYTYE